MLNLDRSIYGLFPVKKLEGCEVIPLCYATYSPGIWVSSGEPQRLNPLSLQFSQSAKDKPEYEVTERETHIHEFVSSLANYLSDLEALKSSGAYTQKEGGALLVPSFSRESMDFLWKIIHMPHSVHASITCHYLAAIGWGPVSRNFGRKGPK